MPPLNTISNGKKNVFMRFATANAAATLRICLRRLKLSPFHKAFAVAIAIANYYIDYKKKEIYVE